MIMERIHVTLAVICVLLYYNKKEDKIEDIKTSTLDYNGERDLSSIINCVIFRL